MSKTIKKILYCSVVIALAGCLTFSIIYAKKTSSIVSKINQISTDVVNANVAVYLSYANNAFFPIYDQVKMGSGTIIKEDDIYYYILTNRHVITCDDNPLLVTDYPRYKVVDAYDNVYEATLLNMDEEIDIALLRITKSIEYDCLSVIELASGNPKKDELVFAIGNPNGQHNTLTVGYIVDYAQVDKCDNAIMHDALIKSGSSGGMLINGDYELVGINTWDVFTETNKEYSGALPISYVYDFFTNINFII